ncbi:MAG: PH domain-containing protein [Bifidobacteriaceae bacterium]|jgi:membrane protein YdbS with pleckstrin-like domain|nr:PH domain-containing protein [Bifidobacteriaceae bacterium]
MTPAPIQAVPPQTAPRRAKGDPIFDPPDLVWQRVSPKLAKLRLAVTVILFAPVGIGGLAAMVATRAWWVGGLVAGWVALGSWLGALVWRRVRAIGYVERADDLIIRKGLLFRSLTVVPYGRLQYLDVAAGPVDRKFGLATLTLNTAAGSLNASLPGLEPDAAARLRDRLAERGNARMAGL